MEHPVKCPHCGGTTYRLLTELRTVECQDCGRSFSINKGAQQEPVPREKPEGPE